MRFVRFKPVGMDMQMAHPGGNVRVTTSREINLDNFTADNNCNVLDVLKKFKGFGVHDDKVDPSVAFVQGQLKKDPVNAIQTTKVSRRNEMGDGLPNFGRDVARNRGWHPYELSRGNLLLVFIGLQVGHKG